MRDGPHDSTDCSVPGSVRQAARGDVRPRAGELGWRRRVAQGAERVYGLVKAFGRRLIDRRTPEKVRHTLEDLVGQRVFGIACGNPDGNDSDRLADDPIHKLLLGRDPVGGGGLAGAPTGPAVGDRAGRGGRLASQPTVSRFENGAGRVALYRLGRELAAAVIERHRRRLRGRVRRITINLESSRHSTPSVRSGACALPGRSPAPHRYCSTSRSKLTKASKGR